VRELRHQTSQNLNFWQALSSCAASAARTRAWARSQCQGPWQSKREGGHAFPPDGSGGQSFPPCHHPPPLPFFNLIAIMFFSFPAVCIIVPFAGFIRETMKSHGHRTQDMFTPFRGQYMLLYVPATPTHNKNGSIGLKLRNRNCNVLQNCSKSTVCQGQYLLRVQQIAATGVSSHWCLLAPHHIILSSNSRTFRKETAAGRGDS